MEIERYSEKEKKKQANFLLPEQLINELRRLVPPKQRSQVVAAALERELARIRVKAALGEYFGAWKPAGA
jgi:hypothetical protein